MASPFIPEERLNYFTTTQCSSKFGKKLLPILIQKYEVKDKVTEQLLKKVQNLQENEKKIIKKLWKKVLLNILEYPNGKKYRRIKSDSLISIITTNCEEKSCVDDVLNVAGLILDWIGFKKSDKCWEYHQTDKFLSKLWKSYRFVLENEQFGIATVAEQMWVYTNDGWKEYEIAIDFERHGIGLLDPQNNEAMRWLQIGKSEESEQKKEMDVSVKSLYDESQVETSAIKWIEVMVNNCWRFRTHSLWEAGFFRSYCTSFNAFRVQWDEDAFFNSYISLNPYKVTLHECLNLIKEEMRVESRFKNGRDHFLKFKLDFNLCNPKIPKLSEEQMKQTFLNDIYKNYPNYPEMVVIWEIDSIIHVAYERTITVETFVNESEAKEEKEEIKSNFSDRYEFNPFLYESDPGMIAARNSFDSALKCCAPQILAKDPCTNMLKVLLHEIITNGYLKNLVRRPCKNEEEIKKKIKYNKNDWKVLELNDKLLVILKKIKKIFHSNTHKKMEYPLGLNHICALLLYCGGSCNIEFSRDQIEFKYEKWAALDFCLQEAIGLLSPYDQREDFSDYLYCGLNKVKLQRISEIKEGYFISCVSTSPVLKVAQLFQGERGCILKFHPSMRRAALIKSCYVGWISPLKYEKEVLFARSDFTEIRRTISWNAHIESDDLDKQVIVLTWSQYGMYYTQILEISKIWNGMMDCNIIWHALDYFDGDTTKVIKRLSKFETWQQNANNAWEYLDENREKFKKNRCWNDNFNLYCIFLKGTEGRGLNAIDYASIESRWGLPWCEQIEQNL